MPVLPHLFRRAAVQDTRILDSRQLLEPTAQTLSHFAHALAKRVLYLQRRQDNGEIIAIPAVYAGLNSGPAPGAVVGIVLGSVAGFLLLIWLFWLLSTGGSFLRSSVYEEEVVNTRRRSRSPRSRRSHRTEMTSRSPVRRERVIRQERIVRDSVPAPRDRSRIRETIILENGGPPMMPPMERRVPGDDIVEVLEEHSSLGDIPPPRRKSRRGSSYR